MSTDAFVVDHPGMTDPLEDWQVIDQFGPLQPGRSYVVFAKGDVFAWVAEATFRLELGSFASDETMFTFGAYPPIFQGGHGSFSLSVATTLPPDEELFVMATLSGRRSQGLCNVRNVKIIVLAVDSVSVATR